MIKSGKTSTTSESRKTLPNGLNIRRAIVPGEEGKENKAEEIHEELMAENFQNCSKKTETTD